MLSFLLLTNEYLVKIVIKLYITTIAGIQLPNLPIQFSVTDIDNFLRNIDPCGPSDSLGIDSLVMSKL